MSKAVLMSIKPKYCEMIFNGEKTIEIRKRAPKLKPPFKVYVYCTLAPKYNLYIRTNKGDLTLNGFVIGEFVCDKIYHYASDYGGCRPSDPGDISTEEISKLSCLSPKELYDYEHSAEPKENCIYLIGVYGLHISRPRFYLKPKGLSRFIRPCKNGLICEECNEFSAIIGHCRNRNIQITRPPQSWCYVEEWDFNE